MSNGDRRIEEIIGGLPEGSKELLDQYNLIQTLRGEIRSITGGLPPHMWTDDIRDGVDVVVGRLMEALGKLDEMQGNVNRARLSTRQEFLQGEVERMESAGEFVPSEIIGEIDDIQDKLPAQDLVSDETSGNVRAAGTEPATAEEITQAFIDQGIPEGQAQQMAQQTIEAIGGTPTPLTDEKRAEALAWLGPQLAGSDFTEAEKQRFTESFLDFTSQGFDFLGAWRAAGGDFLQVPQAEVTPEIEGMTQADAAFVAKQLRDLGYSPSEINTIAANVKSQMDTGTSVAVALDQAVGFVGDPKGEPEIAEEEEDVRIPVAGGIQIFHPDGTQEFLPTPRDFTLSPQDFFNRADSARARARQSTQVVSDFVQAEEDRKLTRELAAAELGPRDFLQKFSLEGGIGVPDPRSPDVFPWLKYIADIDLASENFARNDAFRAQEEANRAQGIADQAAWLRSQANYVEAEEDLAKWEDKMGLSAGDPEAITALGERPSGGVNPGAFVARDFNTPFSVKRQPSFIESTPIQYAGPETFFNQFTPEQQQKSLGIMEAKFGGSPELEQQKLFKGVRAAPFRQGGRVHV